MEGGMPTRLNEKTRERILAAQSNEITEHHIYERLSRATGDPHNKEILKRISTEELAHYKLWRKYTGIDVEPNRLMIWKYVLISKVFGITFGIKLMERGEASAQYAYGIIAEALPESKKVIEDEDRHEKQLVSLIDEERLRYIGSIVLGLNDALVELTGALAGFTLALQSSRLVAAMGLIIGLAAALSMSASEYLSAKIEGESRDPLRASAYTGSAYIATVALLILPFFILENVFHALGLMVAEAIAMILVFTFYVSVSKDIPFKKRFLEMTAISLGIAVLTFAFGFFVKSLVI